MKSVRLKLKIKFPILMRYKKQYKQFMEYLDEYTDIYWLEGQAPSNFTPRCFPGTPVYICCFQSWDKKKLYYKTKAEYERDPSSIEEFEIETED